MQFSIVHVASFWAAIHFPIKFGSENTNDMGQAQRDKTLQEIIAFHGENWKIFELFRSRRHLLGKLKNVNPSLAAIPCTFQRASRPFWLEVESSMLPTDSLFLKSIMDERTRGGRRSVVTSHPHKGFFCVYQWSLKRKQKFKSRGWVWSMTRWLAKCAKWVHQKQSSYLGQM